MSVAPECLDNIIGLSQNDCNCFADAKPYDASVSKSGLYLDQLEGLSLDLVKSGEDCEQGSIWEMMLNSVNEAVKSYKAEVVAMLLAKYKRKRNPFSGVIGSQKFTKSIDLGTTYAGARIYCANIMSGIMSIKRIGLVFEADATFTIDIYDSLTDESIAQYEVQTQANRLTWFNLPSVLNLDMNYEAASENPNYYIVYQVNTKPKDVRGGCGCGSTHYKYYWNTSTPQFRTFEKDKWSEYIMLTGVKGNLISDRENWSATEHLNGIILDAEFKCKITDLICKGELDFQENNLAISTALAIRYKAGQLLIDKILASGNINRYTMTDRERLMGKKNSYVKEYQTLLNYFTDQVNTDANDCLTCNDFDDIMKIGILS